MSTPLRYVYRGSASSYNYNYGGELLASKSGFELLPYERFDGGCDIPLPLIQSTGNLLSPQAGDILTGSSFCTYESIAWFNTDSTETPIGIGETYTIKESDYFKDIYFVVTYENGDRQISEPLRYFNPNSYKFARWDGVSWSNGWFAPPAILYTTTAWLDISNSEILRVRYAALTAITPNGIAPNWTSSVRYTSTALVSSNAGLAGVQKVNSAGSVVQTTIITSNGVDNNGLLQVVRGVWQFSNDASGVLASWIGVYAPGFNPNDPVLPPL